MQTATSEARPSASATARIAPSRSFRAKFLGEVAALGLPAGPGPLERVTAADVAKLPRAAQRYMQFMGVVGHPRVWSFRARFTGFFRMAPKSAWIPCEAMQYNSSLDIARIFHLRLKFGHVLPVHVRDTYVHGHGHMLGRLFDALPIADAADDKIATGELVTYLNDAILFAPSMLLGPEACFTEVAEIDDGDAFDVALTDRGRMVSARVFIGADGAVKDFSTTDRYGTDPARRGEMLRARWSTPIDGWTHARGRPMPTGGRAIWHFASGDFTYADFSFEDGELMIDVPPGG